MTSPRVTIVLATYNWSTVLPYSIGSALRQTFTDFELLVIGDGCTDDSEQVVLAIKDERVRWINLASNTRHQAGPNNEGLRQARGEVIAYLGHDDLWLPHHLSCLIAGLDAGNDLAYGVTELVGPNSSYVEPSWPLEPYRPAMHIPPTGIVHRRDVTERIGGWRHPSELPCDPDVDLWLRAYQAGFRFAFILRLTAVKFPAARRRNVYKSRPCHEQAAWSQRIVNEPRFEVVELIRMLIPAQHTAWQASEHLRPSTYTPDAMGASIAENQKFKGL